MFAETGWTPAIPAMHLANKCLIGPPVAFKHCHCCKHWGSYLQALDGAGWDSIGMSMMPLPAPVYYILLCRNAISEDRQSRSTPKGKVITCETMLFPWFVLGIDGRVNVVLSEVVWRGISIPYDPMRYQCKASTAIHPHTKEWTKTDLSLCHISVNLMRLTWG